MKVEKYKNKYGYEKVKCPFCQYEAHLRKVTAQSPDPLRDLKRHITNAAKNEALDWFIKSTLAGTPETPPHLKYYDKHTIEKPVVTTSSKRQYDNDLSL